MTSHCIKFTIHVLYQASYGELIAHMEADDTCGTQRLLTLKYALSEHPDWQAAFGPVGAATLMYVLKCPRLIDQNHW